MSANLNYGAIQFVIDNIKKEPQDVPTPVILQLSNFTQPSQILCDTNKTQTTARGFLPKLLPKKASCVIDDFKLIEFVQKYQHLYDRSRKDYRDVQLRNSTWDEIGKNLGFPGTECLKRFRNLRDRFCKYKKGLQNGNSSDPVPPIFAKMQFMSDHLVHRTSPALTQALEAAADSSLENNIIISDDIEIAPSTSNSSLSPPSTPPPTSSMPEEPFEQDSIPPFQENSGGTERKRKSLKRMREDLDTCLLDELRRANSELRLNHQPDPLSENEMFGKMIARTLDKLSDEKASETRLHIMHCLHEKLYNTLPQK